jgi:hypothetical protein
LRLGLAGYDRGTMWFLWLPIIVVGLLVFLTKAHWYD